MAILGVRLTTALLKGAAVSRPVLGAITAAVCLTGNLVTARTTFELGLAVGLGALLALVPGHLRITAGLALLAALTTAVGRTGRRGVSTANACVYQCVAPAGVVRCTNDRRGRGRTFGRRHCSGRKHDLAVRRLLISWSPAVSRAPGAPRGAVSAAGVGDGTWALYAVMNPRPVISFPGRVICVRPSADGWSKVVVERSGSAKIEGSLTPRHC
jgi:hypothetical protein